MAERFISDLKRTHSCGALSKADIGKTVVLFGWVQNPRDHGGAVFIDLRDREGLTQVVFEPGLSEVAHGLARELGREDVIGIQGTVVSRGEQVNPKLKTGEIEVRVKTAERFNRAETPPFLIEDQIDTAEDKRLAYRYLDLRRAPMQRTLILRHRMNQVMRQHFAGEGFIEVETPFMGRYTPGGARNFLVPSRFNPGKFYALAESPQLYKQLLMVSGFDRYFQIVRCFRDEDLRGDRQPEFTQIDVEMSFVNQDDVFGVIERLVARLWKELLGVEIPLPLQRLPYDESMRRFGNDKPDMRFGLEHVDLTDLVVKHQGGGVPLLADVAKAKGIVKVLRLPADKALSRTETDKLEEFVKGMGSKGLARAKVDEKGGWTQSPFAKTISAELREAINRACEAKAGDLLLFQFGPPNLVHTVMANLRVHLGKKLGLIPEYGSGGNWRFLWVVDPPLFEYDEERGGWVAAHHPFTRPHESDLPYLDSDPGRVKCYRYDLVLNGYELGGGSIRIHDSATQAKVFKALGIGDNEARNKFGFLLDALKFGAPPHGGIALGCDRTAMLLSGTESLRDVVAFPKTDRGRDLMTGAPGEVDDRQLGDLKIKSTATPS